MNNRPRIGVADAVKHHLITGGALKRVQRGGAGFVRRPGGGRVVGNGRGIGQVKQAQGVVASGVGVGIDDQRVGRAGMQVEEHPAVAVGVAQTPATEHLAVVVAHRAAVGADQRPGEAAVGRQRIEHHLALGGRCQRVDHPAADLADRAFHQRGAQALVQVGIAHAKMVGA